MKRSRYIREELYNCYGDKHKVWFAAANGSTGFRSYFSEIFSPQKFARSYIIKGGPGTGKSSIMRYIADHFEKENGVYIERFVCSSDPMSLDGVIVKRSDVSVAIMDGTAPHVCDATQPGIKEIILNLGEHWDTEGIVSNKEAILSLMERKNEQFNASYTALACAEPALIAKHYIAKKFTKEEKLLTSQRKLIRGLIKESSAKETKRAVSAISTRGYVGLNTLEGAKRKYYVYDRGGSAAIYLDRLRELLLENKKTIVTLYAPISELIIEGIYIPNDDVAFITTHTVKGNIDGNIINTNRFIDDKIYKQCKSEIKELSSMIETAVALGLKHLSSAGEYHMKIEKYYVSNMNFEKNELLRKKLVTEITSLLNMT